MLSAKYGKYREIGILGIFEKFYIKNIIWNKKLLSNKIKFKLKNNFRYKIIKINYKTDLKLILETNIWDWTNIITIVNNKVIMLVKR